MARNDAVFGCLLRRDVRADLPVQPMDLVADAFERVVIVRLKR